MHVLRRLLVASSVYLIIYAYLEANTSYLHPSFLFWKKIHHDYSNDSIDNPCIGDNYCLYVNGAPGEISAL